MSLRIAYVGNFGPAFSTENDVRIALESLGHQVVPIQENTTAGGVLRAEARGADLVLWTGTWENTEGPNYHPGVVPLVDALDVLHDCAISGVPTATYHLDIFWATGRDGRRWWTHPMFQAANVFTADGGHQREWLGSGINHRWLRPAVRHTMTEPGTPRRDMACDVALVGSNGVGYHEDVWPYRRQLADQLRAMCARNGWSYRNPGGDDPKIERDQMNDFYASAKVTVGDSLCLDRERALYWSDRAYEAPGRGGFLIMPQIGALFDDYDGRLPMYDWGDWVGLESMIGSFLADDAGREVVRKECHEIAAGRHTYVQRMQELLALVGLS